MSPIRSPDAQGARNIDGLARAGSAAPTEPTGAASALAGGATRLRIDVAAVDLTMARSRGAS